jgi:uncharacterized protein (TIGR02421 family)
MKKSPVNVQAYSLIDKTILNLAESIKILYYFEPINEEEQKKEFLAGKIENPEFLYRDLEYNPKEIEEELNSLKIPDGELGRIFRKKRRGFLRRNEIIKNRGNGDVVRKITIGIHGVPSEQLIDFANDWLRRTPHVETKKTIPSKVIKKALEEALTDFGLTDWSVEFSDKKLTTVYSAEKKITVCKNRKFTKGDPARLVIHEVGVHILRAANGYEQPLKVLAIGLPGYLPTEEGLALYFEELTGNMNEQKMRDYAARVIGVEAVCQKLDFRQTFNRLKNYGLTDSQAWGTAVRVHRGGGFVKDQVYLKGLLKIKEFAQKDGDFKTLYVGKIGTKDLPLVRKLLREGIIKEAKYIPRFIQ